MRSVIRLILKQRPADTVNIIFLLFLVVLTVVFHKGLPKTTFLISLYTTLIAAQFILIRIKDKGKFLHFFYDLIFPTLCILLIFDSLEWVVHYINSEDIDPILIQLDYLIFNGHPTVMLERIMHPLLTDLMQIAYSTYYFIPIIFGIILLKTKKREEFNRSLFLILFCFYLSYVGYILFPALGPRFTIDHLQTAELQGFIIAERLQDLINRLEGIKRDAFPSGHTAVTVLVLYLAYKFNKIYFWICLPVVSALVFSTVYCRYHYFVDIIAGFILTILTVLIGEMAYKWWMKQQSNQY
jgi:membrane-associated phospholipid phosphatase